MKDVYEWGFIVIPVAFIYLIPYFFPAFPLNIAVVLGILIAFLLWAAHKTYIHYKK